MITARTLERWSYGCSACVDSDADWIFGFGSLARASSQTIKLCTPCLEQLRALVGPPEVGAHA